MPKESSPCRWVVVSEKSGPSNRPAIHNTESSAMMEARRLAILDPDDAFDIYRSIKRVSAPQVLVEEIEDPDECPF